MSTISGLFVMLKPVGGRTSGSAQGGKEQGAVPSGPGDVLDLIRHGRATTRGDVLEATGLSRVTIRQRLAPFVAAGMIVEGETKESTGGRRHRSLAFNTSQSHVLVVAIDT